MRRGPCNSAPQRMPFADSAPFSAQCTVVLQGLPTPYSLAVLALGVVALLDAALAAGCLPLHAQRGQSVAASNASLNVWIGLMQRVSHSATGPVEVR